MMKLNQTKHTTTDRIDRMMVIAKYIGWGEMVVSSYNAERGHMETLTDTGILLILSEDSKTLVTAYIPSIDKIYAVYKRAGFDRPPVWMITKAKKNLKYKHMSD